MNIEVTESAMGALGAAGSAFNRTWGPQATLIDGLESGLGGGPLGREFAKGYIARTEHLKDYVDLFGGAPERLSGSGKLCVLDYRIVEAEINEHYRSLDV